MPNSETVTESDKRREHLARVGRATRFKLRNQKARKYPKPPDEDDTAITLSLAERRDQIIRDLGGPEHISTIKLGAIERYAVLEMHVESWEAFFGRAGFRVWSESWKRVATYSPCWPDCGSSKPANRKSLRNSEACGPSLGWSRLSSRTGSESGGGFCVNRRHRPARSSNEFFREG